MQEEFESEVGRTSDLDAVLETLNALYTFDARGRLFAAVRGGVLPRFVLGRAEEGCVWRFRSDLEPGVVVALARLAGRESGARFEGDWPAPPERLEALRRVLDADAAVRSAVTRAGVTVGELWLFA